MAITDAELDQVRDWVGDTDPTDDQISDRYDIEGTAVKTALVFLRRRRANLLQDPAQWNGPDYSESWGKTLDALADLISDAEGAVQAEDFGGADLANPGHPIVVPVDIGRSDRDRLFG